MIYYYYYAVSWGHGDGGLGCLKGTAPAHVQSPLLWCEFVMISTRDSMGIKERGSFFWLLILMSAIRLEHGNDFSVS